MPLLFLKLMTPNGRRQQVRRRSVRSIPTLLRHGKAVRPDISARLSSSLFLPLAAGRKLPAS
jgi:hypothetical protein